MDTYKTENVVAEITAKIHPADKNIPDCRCNLVLTERHLFVLEDNFNGTFEEHYVIDIKFIDDITVSTPFNTDSTPKAGSAAFYNREVSKREQFRESGSVITPFTSGGRFRRFARPKKYLEVIYNDDNYVKQHLFFDEWDKLPKGFICKFQKLKSN